MKELNILLDELESLCSNQDAFISLDKTENSTTLSANYDGLLVLARALLGLAGSGSEGSHFHLDSSSYLDRANGSLLITKVDAPWNKN
jgi:hypothetical protein